MHIPLTLSSICQDMFVLNNCIRSGYNQRREETYEAKELLIKYLYQHDYCTNVVEHRMVQECWNCDGEGCERCDWTGAYAVHYLVAFTFLVGNKRYRWHTPKSHIDFHVTLTGENPEPFEGGHLRDYRPADWEISYMLWEIRTSIKLRLGVYSFLERIKHVKISI